MGIMPSSSKQSLGRYYYNFVIREMRDSQRFDDLRPESNIKIVIYYSTAMQLCTYYYVIVPGVLLKNSSFWAFWYAHGCCQHLHNLPWSTA